MTTLSFSLEAPKMTSLATAAAMVTAASQSSQWPPWTIAGVIFSIVTIVLGIPGAAVAVHACRKRPRRGRGIQSADTSPNLGTAASAVLVQPSQNPTMMSSEDESHEQTDNPEAQRGALNADLESGRNEDVVINISENNLQPPNIAADTPPNTVPDLIAVELEDNFNYHAGWWDLLGWWDVAGWWGERQ